MDGCRNYTVLSGGDRAQGNILLNNSCDQDLTPGWYRFQGAAGDRMADQCVLTYRCGTHAPGWLSGPHPTVDEGVVIRKVCYHDGIDMHDNCCKTSNNIKVKNCSSYYVYELQKPSGCYRRYCGNADTGKFLTPCWLLVLVFLSLRATSSSETVCLLSSIIALVKQGLYFTLLYFTSLHSPSLHFTSLHFTSLHFTSLHFTSLHFTSLHFTSLHFTSLHFTSLHFTSLHFTSLRFASLRFASLRFASLHFTSLHFTSRLLLISEKSTFRPSAIVPQRWLLNRGSTAVYLRDKMGKKEITTKPIEFSMSL